MSDKSIMVIRTMKYNFCSSIKNLLNIDEHVHQLFIDTFGFDLFKKNKKFGICASYDVTYDVLSEQILDIKIIDVEIYLCTFKILLKKINDFEYLDNFLKNPLRSISDDLALEHINNFLFNRSFVGHFILKQFEFFVYKENYNNQLSIFNRNSH